MSDSTNDATGSGTVSAAKDEAAKVASTAGDQAGQVAHTAAEEAKTVAREVKSQTSDLFTQTQSELRDQAGRQQQRVASGLQALASELGSMADRSDQPGVAADLVRQVSSRAEQVGTWLGDRDPGSLLHEVKSFARRKPGVFIGAAALAGLVAGRLTRALAQGAPDGGTAGASGTADASGATGAARVAPPPPSPTGTAPAPTPSEPVGGGPGLPGAGGTTPVYDRFSETQGAADVDPVTGVPGDAQSWAPTEEAGGDRDDRPHTV